jgi:hypothetical protein
MKSEEFLAKVANVPFEDLCAKRKSVFIGEFTDAIGEFHSRGIYVSQPGFDCHVKVHGVSAQKVVAVSELFEQYFTISDVKPVGQQSFGFSIFVGDLTVAEYVDKLEKVYLTYVL